MDDTTLVHVVHHIDELVHYRYQLSIVTFERVKVVVEGATGNLFHNYFDVRFVLKDFFHLYDIRVRDHLDYL